jgi:hypothetical protein
MRMGISLGEFSYVGAQRFLEDPRELILCTTARIRSEPMTRVVNIGAALNPAELCSAIPSARLSPSVAVTRCCRSLRQEFY